MVRSIAAGATLLATSAFLHGCGDSGPSPSPPGPTPGPSPPSPSPPTPGPDDPSVDPTPAPGPAPPTTPAPPPTPPPTPCVARPAKPGVPSNVDDLNGLEYPQACFELKDKNHFFVIGDWGGQCGWAADNICNPQASWDDLVGHHSSAAPRPMHNRHGDYVEGIDDDAQQRVAASMDAIAAQTPPEFVVSVGDHFYPGGVAEEYHGTADSNDLTQIPSQFKSTFEDIYNSTHMAEAEWMGVLGNHDYGGVCVKQGWPQQIYYTWNQVSKRWVMPAQYYYRNIRFSKDGSADWDEEDFTVDMFFLDSNHCDAHLWNTAQDEDGVSKGHNICGQGNQDETYYCGAFFSPDNTAGGLWTGTDNGVDNKHCNDHFHNMWHDQMEWLEDHLNKSTADWQMIVTHFPPSDAGIRDDLMRVSAAYGVDLIMTGHSHIQTVNYQRPYGPEVDYGDTACVISGGGGGVTSEGHPDAHGHDSQYGFMDMVLTKDQLIINPYSWGTNDDGSQIMMQGATVSKRERADLNDVKTVLV